MYQAGDKLVHPGHGGCTVQGICSREMAGETRQYLVLVPKIEPYTTILAPVDNVQKLGLREIISPETADELLDLFADVQVEWVSDHAKRRQTYEATLKTGNLTSIVKMIKELTVHSAQASLNQSDKDLLPKAQKKLLSEIALAKDIEMDRATCLMQQAIQTH